MVLRTTSFVALQLPKDSTLTIPDLSALSGLMAYTLPHLSHLIAERLSVGLE